jgi:hypothetical protein
MDGSIGELGIQRIVNGAERPQLRLGFRTASGMPRPCLRLDEIKVLSERKNFELVGS